jgi:fatty-acyl-CoA synthase
VDDPVEIRAETVGKSFPGVEVRVIDPNTNKPVATDTV